MASVFDTFEQQLANLTAEITANTAKIHNHAGGERRALVQSVEKHIEECRELLEQMDLEVRQLQSIDKHKYQTRLKSYQTEMARLEKDLKQAKVLCRNEMDAREELFADDGVDQRTRLLNNSERLERTGRKMEAGYRLAIETEQIGAELLGNLHSQRETIHRGRERLRETGDDLNKSSRILTGMMRRILQNRAIGYLVGGVMLIVIIITIYLVSVSR